jgi:hypothetical protein
MKTKPKQYKNRRDAYIVESDVETDLNEFHEDSLHATQLKVINNLSMPDSIGESYSTVHP